MYPQKSLIEKTSKKLNDYIQNELMQTHSEIHKPWVSESLRQEYYMSLESGFDTSDSTISERVVAKGKPRIMRMYTDAETYMSDLPGILSGRVNDANTFDASTTSYGEPMPRGSYASRTKKLDVETFRNPINLLDVE